MKYLLRWHPTKDHHPMMSTVAEDENDLAKIIAGFLMTSRPMGGAKIRVECGNRSLVLIEPEGAPVSREDFIAGNVPKMVIPRGVDPKR